MADYAKVSAALQAALDREGNLLRLADVFQAIERGAMQLWTKGDSAIVTTLAPYPTGKIDLVFYLAGGEMADIEALVPEIEAWGRERGATRSLMAGRAGWSRSFLTQKQGWEPSGVVLTHSLS